MSPNLATPWHKRSSDLFWQERLPAMLAERLPVVGYAAPETGTYTRRVEVTIAAGTNGDLTLVFDDLAQPDETGVFDLDGAPYVVVPLASHQVLDEATISCMGDQLYDYVEARLGQAPSDLPWDRELARAWLPLDTWVSGFLQETAQRLDTTNWTSRHTHLRRLLVLHHEDVVDPGQAKVVCPFESPEGPNMGRVFTIAQGAAIRKGRLVVTDEHPAAWLGLSASMIPFLEHNDANRSLMGANMMRQGIVPENPEPALVQTGYEPDEPAFWTGRNLLTAFVSWGADTCADGIAISESCAKRLDYPYPAEVGDKLANRQGTKGVVSRVLPDDEMPHLADGTPVELVYSFGGMHVRLNHGQALEAAWGRVAHAEGKVVLAPPFAAPNQDELRARLERAGLPSSGMEILTMGRGGPQLERPSLIGWVYWNRLAHLARGKIKVSASGKLQMHGTMEGQALREIGAYENLREALNLRAGRRPDAEKLSAQIAAGPVKQMGPPTPAFSDLVQRLQVAGIQTDLRDGQVAFRWAEPTGAALTLAQPVPHPWLLEQELTAIGSIKGLPDEGEYGWFGYLSPRGEAPVPLAEAYALLVEANARLARTTSSQAPASLITSACTQLEARVKAFFETLLHPAYLNLRERQLFSGRAVLAPGTDFAIDRVGLPDEIAWELFGPFAVRTFGDESAVQDRTEQAARALDEVMARSWVIVNRAPTFTPTAMLAFRPLRVSDPAIRLHPLACALLDADFDGDQAAIYVPISEAAQHEAATKLSVAGHLARDPGLIAHLLPPPEALWGLAHLGLSKNGLDEVSQLAGIKVAAPNGVITEDTLAEAMRSLLARDGVEAVLIALQRLMDRGFLEVQRSGASISPFIGESMARPPSPGTDDPEEWEAYQDQVREQLLSSTNYDSPDIGPQLLAVKVRERGRRHLSLLTCPWGPYQDIYGQPLTIRHSLVEGFTPAEMEAYMANARRGLASVWQRWQTLGGEAEEQRSSSFTVLARARRSKRPGIVFARAAAAGEVDPLTDVESRLLVGVPVKR